jgi:phage tail-like protein
MASQRPTPYGAFNFIVDFTTGDADTVRGGFQEVTGMNTEVTSAEYRVGNSKVNHPIKVNGLYKVGDVTLKRGVIGELDLIGWIKALRAGDHSVLRTVYIHLQDEAHTSTVMTWTLVNARPMRWTAPSLNAKTGTDVAIEELVLACEDMDVS